MRIEFITQKDPIYILPFFEEFVRAYGGEFEIAAVHSAPTMGNRSRVQMVRELTALYGVPGFIRLAVTRLYFALRSRMRRIPGAAQFYGLRQLCDAYGIPYQSIGNPNHESFREGLRSRCPDVLVSVACPFVLRSEVLAIPRLGCVNIHHAPLPFYKGMMPSFWQMYHGAPTVGVTVHFMTAKLDEGDAIVQENLPVERGETLHQLIRRSKRNGAHTMARALRLLEKGIYTPVSLGGERGSYFTFPKIDEIAEFRRRGLRAI